MNIIRVRKEKKTGTKVSDVDGSCLHLKQQSKSMPGIDNVTLPYVPLIGWEFITTFWLPLGSVFLPDMLAVSLFITGVYTQSLLVRRRPICWHHLTVSLVVLS